MSMVHVYVHCVCQQELDKSYIGMFLTFNQDGRSRIWVEHELGTSYPSAEGTGNSDVRIILDTPKKI